MKLSQILLKTIFWILSLTLFIISFPRTWSLYTLGFFLFLSFIYWILFYIKYVKEFVSLSLLILPSVIFFFLQLINIILRKENIINIESQLMFFLVPLLGFPFFQNEFIEERKGFFFSSFIYGIFTISFILIILALICFKNKFNPEVNYLENLKANSHCFFSVDFSKFEHPTYLGMKIIWSIMLMNFLFRQAFNVLLRGLILLFFAIIIFLLASKAGILMLTILIIFYLYNFINKNFKNKVFKYLVSIFLTLFLFVFIFSISKEIFRINIFINELETGFSQSEIDWKNLDQRTREWHCALQLIKEKPIFGHGITRVEDRMVEEYLKNGWVEEARLRYNAHNQFLETQMTFGIPGTLSLLWMLFTPLIHRKKLIYPKLATAFVFMMTFFLMFESMFVRQWGIMFFTLFYCMLVFPAKENK